VRAVAEIDRDVILILPGAPTRYEQELRALAEQLGVSARVLFPDWLSEEELDGLYALSRVFALPSFIEGFGLPVLEAMARGVPVACANIAALREVAGDAALFFDPARQDDVTGAVSRLLEDHTLTAELVRRGHQRVAQFPWAATGTATLAGYRQAMAARASRRT
jgi:glycosyltransferase involved in cell wall biosynthesis